MDDGWTFPIKDEFFSDEEWVARLAGRLATEMENREMKVSPDTALLTAGQLYAAQKIARGLEMCEIRLEDIANGVSGSGNSTYEAIIDLGKSVVDAAGVTRVVVNGV